MQIWGSTEYFPKLQSHEYMEIVKTDLAGEIVTESIGKQLFAFPVCPF